jgi:predicted metalloprotease
LLAVAALLVAGLASGATQRSSDAQRTPEAQGRPEAQGSSKAIASQATSSASPSTSPTATAWVDDEAPLMDNALYKAGRMPAAGCSLPTDRLRSSAAVVAYARVMVTCLDRSWGAVLIRAGFYFYPPEFEAYKGETTSPCEPSSDDDVVAFYCSMDHKIYLDWSEYVSKRRDEQPWVQGALMDVMAHEYGHHVQELAGIGTYYDDRYERTTGDAQLQDSRRMELQASCFGAAFLGADQQALDLVGDRLAGLQDDQYSGDEWGGDRDHGSAKNNERWTRGAFESASPGSCNTWEAPPDQVS